MPGLGLAVCSHRAFWAARLAHSDLEFLILILLSPLRSAGITRSTTTYIVSFSFLSQYFTPLPLGVPLSVVKGFVLFWSIGCGERSTERMATTL